MFINSQTGPLHANEGNQATRKGTTTNYYAELLNYRIRLKQESATEAEHAQTMHNLMQDDMGLDLAEKVTVGVHLRILKHTR